MNLQHESFSRLLAATEAPTKAATGTKSPSSREPRAGSARRSRLPLPGRKQKS